jgi:type I restriction enzyme M protein
MEEIENNEFNLNISRYVSTAEAETGVGLPAVNHELHEIENRLNQATSTYNMFLKELNLPPV